jgi:hypothetical protein
MSQDNVIYFTFCLRPTAKLSAKGLESTFCFFIQYMTCSSIFYTGFQNNVLLFHISGLTTEQCFCNTFSPGLKMRKHYCYFNIRNENAVLDNLPPEKGSHKEPSWPCYINHLKKDVKYLVYRDLPVNIY